MSNRETFDWKKAHPDVPVTMTLLYDRNAQIVKDGKKVQIKDDGTKTKDGKTWDWHRYPVKVAGDELTMFTTNDTMHKLLQTLGINNEGDKFTITKRQSYNEGTGASAIFYEIESAGETLTTNGDTPPKTEKTTPAEKIGKEIEKIKGDKKELSTPVAFKIKPLFEEIANAVWDTAYAWVTKNIPEGELSQEYPNHEQEAKIREIIVKDCTTMVNTLIMQVNGKWNK